MSRANAIPDTFRLREIKEPTSWPLQALPTDDFEKHIPTSSVDIQENLRALIGYHQGEEAVDNLEFDITPRSGLSAASGTRADNRVSAGELRFRRAMRILDEIIDAQPPPEQRGIYPYPTQRRGVRRNLITMAPFIYGTDWEADREKFCRQMGITKHFRWRCTVQPRRRGKTQELTLTDADLSLLGMPIHIKYYSQSVATCREAQQKILDYIEPWLLKHCKDGLKAITHRPVQNPMIKLKWGAQISFAACGTTNTQSATRQRGATVNLCSVDELAFVNHDVLTQDVAVHSALPTCGLITYTTPTTDENVASELLDAKDEKGEFLFDRSYVAAACAKCLANHTKESCYHVLDALPDHLVGENKLQKALMSADEMDQEMRAIITISGSPAFPPAYIENSDLALYEQPRTDLSSITSVPVAFLCIDPSGLSPESSDVGLSLLFFTERRRVVIAGLASISATNIPTQEKGMEAFLDKLRDVDCLRKTVFVVIIENNAKYQAQHILGMLQSWDARGPFYFPVYSSNGDQVGPHTVNETKIDWVRMVQWLILHRLLRFSDPVITLGAGGDQHVAHENGAHALQMFKQQALGYKFYKTQQGKWTTNGKNGKKTKDDLFDSVCIGATNGHAFIQEGNVHNIRLKTFIKGLGHQSVFTRDP